MQTICGGDCCGNCARVQECGGCISCGGRPFGGNCIAAETIKTEGMEAFLKLKEELIHEINTLKIPELSVENLNLLNGFYVNLEYQFANGSTIKFLNDRDIYFGNQIERKNRERCYGVVADRKFILVCEYGCNGSDPELLLYKRR